MAAGTDSIELSPSKGSALLIVDLQNDFCPGGSLPVPDGDKIVPLVNSCIAIFQAAGLPVFASRDWHPADTAHFITFGGQWPPHCMQGTFGAAFHPDLLLPSDALLISKGMQPDSDAYSAFQGVTEDDFPFHLFLGETDINHLYVVGLATDYCVKATVLDALQGGLEVTVLTDAVKGVELHPGDSARALAEMSAAGAQILPQ